MDSHEIFEVFRAFTHSDVTQRWFCPQSDMHVALLQWNTESLTKTSKSCFKVKRTLRPAKIGWVIHCSVLFHGFINPTFERDQFSSTSRFSNPHWQNTTLCPDKTEHFELRNSTTRRGCSSQKCCGLWKVESEICKRHFPISSCVCVLLCFVDPMWPSHPRKQCVVLFYWPEGEED